MVRSLGALGVAIAFAATSGCSDPGASPESLGTSEAALSANEKTAFDYFLAKGLTNFQAAGIIGNLVQESNVDPKAAQPGGPGRGIAQWSVGGRWDSDSNDNAVAYASKHSASVYALSLQLDFIWYELTTFSGYGLASLKKTTNVTDATIAFENDFEGCGTCLQTQRVTYAKAALTAYGGDEVDAGAKPDAGEKESDAGTHEVPHEGDAGGAPPNAAAPSASQPDLGDDAGGCTVTTRSHAPASAALVLVAAALVLAARRRR